MVLLITFNAYYLPFQNGMFSEEITKNITKIQWWLSQADDDSEINKRVFMLKHIFCNCFFSFSETSFRYLLAGIFRNEK